MSGGGEMKAKGKREESGLSGLALALQTTEKEEISPRRAAPDGSSCEKHPRIRPKLVVDPSGAARRRLGLAFAIQKRLCNSASPAPRGECESGPQSRLNCALPLGAARRRWRLVVPCSSQRWLCRVPLGGVGVVPCSFQRRLRGLPTPAPDWFVPCSSQKLLPLCHRARVAVLRCVRLAPPLARPSGRLRRGDM